MEDLQGEYDLIIGGTGLTESLIAGCCSQNNKKLIHFDKSKEYGGFLTTKGLHHFISWANDNAHIYINNISKKLPPNVRNGEYSIDLFPIIIFSCEKLMTVLFNSKTFESLHTYLVEGLFFRAKDSFRLIPSSKSSIFSDRSIPLRQKRSLMKIIYYFLPPETYGHSVDISDVISKVEEYQDKPFRELLKASSFDDDLAGAFEYFLASASHPLLTSEAVPRIRSFFDSYGKYGPTPFLEFRYGASEAPQIFSRHSAVYGGIYILNHCPTKIERDEEKDELILHVDDIGEIRTKNYIANPENLESTGETKLIAHREVVLLDRKFLDSDRAVAVISPGVLKNTHPVYIYQFDHVFASCRQGEYLIHFLSMGEIHETVDILLDELRQQYLQELKEKATKEQEKPQSEETAQNQEENNLQQPDNQQQTESQPIESQQQENQEQENQNAQESQEGNEKHEDIDDPNGFIIFRVGFTLRENIPKTMKGVIPVCAPSLGEFTIGTDYFVDAAEQIMKEIYPDIQFYPKPTEEEVQIDEEMETPVQPEEPSKPSEETPKEGENGTTEHEQKQDQPTEESKETQNSE